MIYLIFFCLSINWFVICASDVADGKLQTLSTFSEKLQKDDTRSNYENLQSRLLDEDLDYFKHAPAKAINGLSRDYSKSRIEEESDNKPNDDGSKGSSGDAVVDGLNGQTKHNGAVKSPGVKGNFMSDHFKLGKKHDQSSASAYTTHSDYESAVSKSSDKDNEGPLASGDHDLFAERSEPIYTFSDINIKKAPQWDLKNNIKVTNLDTGSASESTIERYDELSRNTEGDDVRLRDSILVEEIPLDVLSNRLDSTPGQNLIYRLYVFPVLRRKPISRLSELYRSIKPYASFKQIEDSIGSFGPSSMAGTNLYGAYASAHTPSYPYGGFGYNQGSFGFGENGGMV